MTSGKGTTIAWLVIGVVTGGSVAAAAIWGGVSLFRPQSVIAGRVPVFVDESGTSGVEQVYDGDFHFFVGGGVASLDCDGDGRPDLYLAGGANTARLYRNRGTVGGNLDFEWVTSPVTDLTSVTGAYPLDVDSDGLTDLAVLRQGENVMLRGLGGCRFERANELWGIDGGSEWTAAFSATWETGEDLPTLAFGNYVALTDTGERAGGCSDSDLFRPVNSGYEAPIRLTPGWCTLSILFSDWDRTGQRDLRMTNDRHYYRDGEEQLWEISAGRPPRLYTSDDGWRAMEIWGMGIASRDIDGDGRPEIYLTSQGDNKLQTLVDDSDGPSYEDIALPLGATAHRPFEGDTTKPSTAWHAQFEDVNNDGLTDLFVTKGNVDAMPEFAQADPNNLLMGQPDGMFIEGAELAGLLDYSRSRGAILIDLNLDGLLDLVVVERGENVRLWRNTGDDNTDEPSIGNWLEVDIGQQGANSDAIGSWIEVKTDSTTTERELTIGGGHAGGSLGWAHFGLGRAGAAQVRVQWPDGEIGPWMSVSANQFVTIQRGAGAASPWLPVED